MTLLSGSNRWLSGILQEMAIFAEIVTKRSLPNIIYLLTAGPLQSNRMEMHGNSGKRLLLDFIK
jgi:hypothetical protein